jgi:hypothetical protein
VAKTFGFKACALVASFGLMALVSGCNPEEPAKPVTPAPSTPPAKVTPAKPADTKGAPPAVTPAPKVEEKKK